jgi:hypothetical protein
MGKPEQKIALHSPDFNPGLLLLVWIYHVTFEQGPNFKSYRKEALT